MPDDAPITYRDVATILALIDGPQRGRLTLAQGDMEIRVEKESDGPAAETLPEPAAETP